jgi:cell division protein FtsB
MAHTKKRLSHRRELYYIFCIIAVLTILLVSFFGPSGYRELQKSRLELQEQHTRVDQLEQENAERLKHIEKLRSDKNAWEESARESGYARQDEIIQQVPKKPEKPKTNKPSNSR